jgi:phosphohistidine phosphatase
MTFVRRGLKMKLYLVQHAKAASEQVDPQRGLTEEGRSDIKKIAAFIKPLNLYVDYLWHSGKRRAEQTAEVLAEVVKVNKAVNARNSLGPNDDITILKEELLLQQAIMVVGHLPFLSKLASLLLVGSESANTVAFKNAGIVCLDRSEENRWQIDWIIIPELLA